MLNSKLSDSKLIREVPNSEIEKIVESCLPNLKSFRLMLSQGDLDINEIRRLLRLIFNERVLEEGFGKLGYSVVPGFKTAFPESISFNLGKNEHGDFCVYHLEILKDKERYNMELYGTYPIDDKRVQLVLGCVELSDF